MFYQVMLDLEFGGVDPKIKGYRSKTLFTIETTINKPLQLVCYKVSHVPNYRFVNYICVWIG